jgi:hypothetical protein
MIVNIYINDIYLDGNISLLYINLNKLVNLFKYYYDKYEQAKAECRFLIWNGTIKSCCTTVYLKVWPESFKL